MVRVVLKSTGLVSGDGKRRARARLATYVPAVTSRQKIVIDMPTSVDGSVGAPRLRCRQDSSHPLKRRTGQKRLTPSIRAPVPAFFGINPDCSCPPDTVCKSQTLSAARTSKACVTAHQERPSQARPLPGCVGFGSPFPSSAARWANTF